MGRGRGARRVGASCAPRGPLPSLTPQPLTSQIRGSANWPGRFRPPQATSPTCVPAASRDEAPKPARLSGTPAAAPPGPSAHRCRPSPPRTRRPGTQEPTATRAVPGTAQSRARLGARRAWLPRPRPPGGTGRDGPQRPSCNSQRLPADGDSLPGSPVPTPTAPWEELWAQARPEPSTPGRGPVHQAAHAQRAFFARPAGREAGGEPGGLVGAALASQGLGTRRPRSQPVRERSGSRPGAAGAPGELLLDAGPWPPPSAPTPAWLPRTGHLCPTQAPGFPPASCQRRHGGRGRGQGGARSSLCPPSPRLGARRSRPQHRLSPVHPARPRPGPGLGHFPLEPGSAPSPRGRGGCRALSLRPPGEWPPQQGLSPRAGGSASRGPRGASRPLNQPAPGGGGAQGSGRAPAAPRTSAGPLPTAPPRTLSKVTATGPLR